VRRPVSVTTLRFPHRDAGIGILTEHEGYRHPNCGSGPIAFTIGSRWHEYREGFNGGTVMASVSFGCASSRPGITL